MTFILDQHTSLLPSKVVMLGVTSPFFKLIKLHLPILKSVYCFYISLDFVENLCDTYTHLDMTHVHFS